jgi:hypothetical protein
VFKTGLMRLKSARRGPGYGRGTGGEGGGVGLLGLPLGLLSKGQLGNWSARLGFPCVGGVRGLRFF